MHDGFISVSHQTCRPPNVKVIHEWQVAKHMGWGMLIVERGVRGSPPRKFYNSRGPWMQFNVLLDHWSYNHKE